MNIYSPAWLAVNRRKSRHAWRLYVRRLLARRLSAANVPRAWGGELLPRLRLLGPAAGRRGT
jgi:hypothetical protein